MGSELVTFRIEVLLSLQRALWEIVTPALRAVAVQAAYPRIVVRFVYEEQVPESAELPDEAGTHVCADFLPPVTVETVIVVQHVGVPLLLGPGEEWVFMRREPLVELPLPPRGAR